MRLVLALSLLCGSIAFAADDPAVPRAVLDKQIIDSLRDIHNRGADLYNNGDPGGCYRLLEGMLLGVRPLIGHRPDIQKLIDDGLTEADNHPSIPKRAYILHELVVKVRGVLKGDVKLDPMPKVGGPIIEKLPLPKIVPDSPPKQSEPKKEAMRVTVGGVVVLNGKPLSSVAIYFVLRNDEALRVGDAITDAEGKYTIKDLPPGKYTVLISASAGAPPELAKAIPAAYDLVATSPLTCEIGSVPIANFDWQLKTN